ncbi:hypothetical protein GJ496_000806 [Pomphorhynchus laevis]|nr:hypothetical protein GJ496_000806 [Pomphorhynchus laevis]
MITRSRASSIARSEEADTNLDQRPESQNASDVETSGSETPKVTQTKSSISSPAAKLPKGENNQPKKSSGDQSSSDFDEENYGGPNLNNAQLKEIIAQKKAEGNYIHLEKNSITGACAINWKCEFHEISPSPWFANLSLRINEASLSFELNDDNNIDMTYLYYTSMNPVNEHLIAYISRERSSAVGNYIVEFRGSRNPGSSLADCFSRYYREQMVENSLVSSDLLTTLGITWRLSQSLVPIITMGSTASNNVSFYAVGWILYIHRLFFLTTDQLPIAVAIANDHMQWVDISVEDNIQGVSSRITEAVAAQRLVILADDFTVSELAVLRLIANGLPRLATNADSASVILLDELHTPVIPILALGRGSAPEYPADVPTALEIALTIIRLSRILYDGADCYAGLIRASATAFRFRGRGDHRAYIDGFLQHRRSTWIMPSFRNPLVSWFGLANSNTNAPYDNDLASFIGNKAEDQVRMLLVTCCTISVCASTVLHRWSISSSVLQHYYNGTGDTDLGTAINFLHRRLIVGINADCCNFMTLTALLLDDICYENLPAISFGLVSWNGSMTNRVAPLDDHSAWVGGWSRSIPYPVPPAAVLYIFKVYPSIWGYLRSPVTFTAGYEMVSTTSIRKTFIDITHGDHILVSAVKSRQWFLSTGYATAVLNAVSQHCSVRRWENAEIYIMGPTSHYEDVLNDIEYTPAMIYNADARLFTVGTIWHFDWFNMAGIGLRWQKRDLPPCVECLFASFTLRYLTAGVNPSGTLNLQLPSKKGMMSMDKEFYEFKNRNKRKK